MIDLKKMRLANWSFLGGGVGWDGERGVEKERREKEGLRKPKESWDNGKTSARSRLSEKKGKSEGNFNISSTNNLLYQFGKPLRLALAF